ncbi:hypothetical protein D3C75_914430 [compost metagenome]
MQNLFELPAFDPFSPFGKCVVQIVHGIFFIFLKIGNASFQNHIVEIYGLQQFNLRGHFVNRITGTDIAAYDFFNMTFGSFSQLLATAFEPL